jgi:hypothetical protein
MAISSSETISMWRPNPESLLSSSAISARSPVRASGRHLAQLSGLESQERCGFVHRIIARARVSAVACFVFYFARHEHDVEAARALFEWLQSGAAQVFARVKGRKLRAAVETRHARRRAQSPTAFARRHLLAAKSAAFARAVKMFVAREKLFPV